MAGSISGKVTNASGDGVANVTVQATGGGGGAPATASTNNSGKYQITNLNAGMYGVQVSPGQGSFTPTYRITITQNQNMTGRDFSKNPHG